MKYFPQTPLRSLPLGLITYPLAVHLAVLAGHPEWALCGLWLLGLLLIWGRGSVPLQVGLSILLSLLLGWALWHGSLLALFMQPLLMNLAMLVVFAASLLPGREPLITLFTRVVAGKNSPEVALYTRKLTWVWSGVALFLVVETLLLAVLSPLWVWSWFSNVFNYLLIVLVFVGEYLYRSCCRRSLGVERPVEYLRLFRNFNPELMRRFGDRS